MTDITIAPDGSIFGRRAIDPTVPDPAAMPPPPFVVALPYPWGDPRALGVAGDLGTCLAEGCGRAMSYLRSRLARLGGV